VSSWFRRPQAACKLTLESVYTETYRGFDKLALASEARHVLQWPAAGIRAANHPSLAVNKKYRASGFLCPIASLREDEKPWQCPSAALRKRGTSS